MTSPIHFKTLDEAQDWCDDFYDCGDMGEALVKYRGGCDCRIDGEFSVPVICANHLNPPEVYEAINMGWITVEEEQ